MSRFQQLRLRVLLRVRMLRASRLERRLLQEILMLLLVSQRDRWREQGLLHCISNSNCHLRENGYDFKPLRKFLYNHILSIVRCHVRKRNWVVLVKE